MCGFELLRQTPLLGALFVSLLCAGCTLFSGPKGILETDVKNSKVSSRQLAILNSDFVGRYADQIEESADSIAARTKDSAVKRNALLWKIHAIPAGFRAASREDSYVAYIDLSVLCRQMVQFFETGDGAHVFGDEQQTAIQTSTNLVHEIKLVGDSLALPPDVSSEDEALVEGFAQQQPIRSLQFARASVIPIYVEKVAPREKELFDAVGSLTSDVSSMPGLMALYSAEIPKLVRWQSELLLMDMSDTAGVGGYAERALAVLENAPKLVQDERIAVVEALHTERVESLAQIDTMRRATLAVIPQERAAMIDGMRATLATEREATLQQLAAERAIVIKEMGSQREIAFKELGEERAAALKEIDAISRRRMDDALEHGVGLIDHAFMRALEGLALAAIAMLVAALLWRRRNVKSGGS